MFVQDDAQAELGALNAWLTRSNRQAELRKQLKDAEAALDKKALDKYPELSVDDIKTLVVDDKWLGSLAVAVGGETERVSQRLTTRVHELAERYDAPLPALSARAQDLEAKVGAHLQKMGYVWD